MSTNQDSEHEKIRRCSKHFVCIPIQFMTELAASQTTLDVIRTVARWFYKIFQADRSSITLHNGDGMLKVIAMEGVNAIPLGVEVPIIGTMVGRVYTSGKTEYCRDLTQPTDIDCKKLLTGNILSCIDVPLVQNGLCFGTINVGRSQIGAFNDTDVRKLESVAYLISALMYIDNLTDKLRAIADTDSLTGVLNRRSFLRQFAEIRSEQRRSRGIGIALIDLDHFKKVNDCHGHKAGDQVLVHFCHLLRKVCRNEDLIARFGGEEFCILANNIALQDFKNLLDRTLDTIRHTPTDFAQSKISITASIGAVHMKHFADNEFDKIYSQADKALYRAKNGGRDRVEFALMSK